MHLKYLGEAVEAGQQVEANHLFSEIHSGEFGDKRSVGAQDYMGRAIDFQDNADPGHLLRHARSLGGLSIAANQYRFWKIFHGTFPVKCDDLNRSNTTNQEIKYIIQELKKEPSHV